MSATEEQLAIIGSIGMDVREKALLCSQKRGLILSWCEQHVTYIVIMFCMGFVIYLWSNLLISLYHNSGRNAPKTEDEGSSHPGSRFWNMLISGATAHYGSGSTEPKVSDYDALPSATRSDDSIELGTRTVYGRNSAAHPAGGVVFDRDLEGRSMEDMGDDSYWEQHDIEEDDDRNIQEVRLR